jgi:uncharacterized membrane protein YhdT
MDKEEQYSWLNSLYDVIYHVIHVPEYMNGLSCKLYAWHDLSCIMYPTMYLLINSTKINQKGSRDSVLQNSEVLVPYQKFWY